MSALQKIIDIELEEVGYIEKASNASLDSETANKGLNNYTKYSRDINALGLRGYQGSAWCCTHQFWVEVQAVGLEQALKNWHMTKASYVGYNCFDTYNKFAAAGKTSKKPKLCCLVVFTFSHIGRVIGIDGDYITTVEGNTSAATYDRNGGMVAKKRYKYNDPKIKGYCIIDYNGVAASSPYLKLGSNGSEVKELQQNLNKLGYNCGTADGDFGQKTLEAVKKFQEAYDLQVDGKVGNATREKIKEELEKLNKKLSFMDVKEKDCFYEAVKWAISKNITSGKTATMFMPKDKCTRAEAITFLWRFAGMPKSLKKANPFVDVKPSDYYYEAVLWAVENDITEGISKDKFMPDELVTRSQFVTFLYRYNKQPLNKTSAKNPFVDVAQTDYFYDAVLWAADNKITSGTSATKFSPADACTREQAITFLWRAK